MTTTVSKFREYVFHRELSKGPLGTTYLAEHAFLKQLFALTVIPAKLDILEALQREIPQIAKIDHPHIAPLTDVTQEGEYYYLASPLPFAARGIQTLKDFVLSKETLTEETIYSLAEQMALAIDAAHLNLAHLGLSARNILVSEENRVVITEFGLSRILSIKEHREKIFAHLWQGLQENLDEPFHELYTLLAPEQKRGLNRGGKKSDIYAFGVILYFLQMKKFPEGAFPKPETRRDWSTLIFSCMHPDPERRPSSLLPLVRGLERKNHMPKLKPREIERPHFSLDPAAALEVDTTVVKFTPQKKDPKVLDPILTEMQVVEGGEFMRGSNRGARDEAPEHKVNLASFAMDIHPVTNEQFIRFLEVMGGEKDANNSEMIRLRESRIKRDRGKLLIETGYQKHPVTGVTWYGATAYAKWVGKRLPTEAEWEVACKGGEESSTRDIERSQANFFNTDTTAVMSYPSNEYGLFDMLGNVYEWCSDWYEYNYYDVSALEPDNPEGPPQGVYRVLRGGCWKSSKEDLRITHRHRNNPGEMNRTYGFRCAADVK